MLSVGYSPELHLLRHPVSVYCSDGPFDISQHAHFTVNRCYLYAQPPSVRSAYYRLSASAQSIIRSYHEYVEADPPSST